MSRRLGGHLSLGVVVVTAARGGLLRLPHGLSLLAFEALLAPQVTAVLEHVA